MSLAAAPATRQAQTRTHGTCACRHKGVCRVNPCDPCREAGRRYQRRNEKLRRAGRVALVDAEAARLHVKELMAAGMTPAQLEAASGVYRTAIRCLVGTMPNRKQSARIKPSTERALLALTLNRGRPVGDATVPPEGTLRRLQALQAIGYPQRDLALMAGRSARTPFIQAGRRGARVRAEVAREVAELYERLRDTPGPSSRAQTVALGKGWLPPIWWDDDTIDDPAHEPAGLRSYTDALGVLLDDVTAPRAARVKLLAKRGLNPDEIAERIGVSKIYVLRDLRSHAVALKGDPGDHTLDDIAVERAMWGDGVALNRRELRETVRRLHEDLRLGDAQIGERIGMSQDAVLKIRQRHMEGKRT